MTIETERGYIRGLSFAQYLEIDAVNPSLLVHALDSWKQFDYVRRHGYEPATDTRFGSALHGMVELLPSYHFDELFSTMPDFSRHADNLTADGKPSNRRTKWVERQEEEYRIAAEAEGKELLNRTEVDRCRRMLASIESCPEAMRYIDGADKEVTLVARLDGVMCKGRPDGYDADLHHLRYIYHERHGGVLWDMKTTPTLTRFGRTAADLHYLLKMEFYRRLLAANGKQVSEVKLIAVLDSKRRQSDGEYNHCPDCVVYDVPMIALDNQTQRINKLLDEYKECERTGNWPGMSRGEEIPLEIPLYSMSDDFLED